MFYFKQRIHHQFSNRQNYCTHAFYKFTQLIYLNKIDKDGIPLISEMLRVLKSIIQRLSYISICEHFEPYVKPFI